jgi:uncharacterized protein
MTLAHPSLLTDTTRSPHVRLRATGSNDVTWTGQGAAGFWADRSATCREKLVPTMQKLMEGTEKSHFLQNLKIAAGLADGKFRGPRWNDGDFYKWLEAAIATLGTAPSPQLEQAIDSMIKIITKAQRNDGYIHSFQIINGRSGGDLPALNNPMDFEMYNMGHLIRAGVVHHRVTGKDTLLSVALKAANYLDRAFANPAPAVARHGICPSHLMAIVELYRETREKRYLDLAVRLLNMRDLIQNGDDDNQDRVPLRKQTTAHGHAVRATYLYASAADIYAETGDETLLAPLQSIWSDLVEKKLYITGGCGALFDGASPDGIADQQLITRVHQSFGRNYQLPQSTSHNETCAAVGSVMWNWRMLQITGESRFGDLIEETLFNSVLTGVDLGGTKFFYTNTLRQLDPMPTELRWNRHREEFIGCFCCPPNVARTIAELANYAYVLSPRGVAVILFGSNSLDTRLPDRTHVKLRQETSYPWDGAVRFTIATAGEFTLSLRIPMWASGATAAMNGQHVSEIKAGSFLDIHRTWNAGDVVELALPVSPRFVEANPYVEECRNHVAVRLGPLVYCLESVDLPARVSLMDVRIDRSSPLTAAPSQELAGLSIIKARGTIVESAKWASLYRDVAPSPRREIDLALVPYFAWDNRGSSEMTVWIPLA